MTQEVLRHFTEISKIPRGSGNEQAISGYLMAFAQQHGLEAKQDTALNVVIYKSAQGSESEPVILQCHMDMVCEKDGDSSHDFLTDPIILREVEEQGGKFIYAQGTTLGADNGLGMAMILTVLASGADVDSDSGAIAHPPIEAVFTTDEETGMSGMAALDAGWLSAARMLNLDSSNEAELCVGCAGGVRLEFSLPVTIEDLGDDASLAPFAVFDLEISGLLGGHSGVDIHLGRANANVLLARVLAGEANLGLDARVISICGGQKDNAIPREASARLALPESRAAAAAEYIAGLQEQLRGEYRVSDPGITLELRAASAEATSCISNESLQKILAAILLLPSGVLGMSQNISELVESSSNIGIVTTDRHAAKVSVHCAIRSSVSAKKDFICRQAKLLAGILGAEAVFSKPYPSWEYNPDSALREKCAEVYERTLGKTPAIKAVHAGLECGLMLEKIPRLDIVSYGCDIFDMHTPNEHFSVDSLDRIWAFTKELLAAL